MTKLRNVAVVGFAQAPIVAADEHHTSPEMLYPVVRAALESAGLERKDVDYQCAGSSDYVDGRAFSFSQVLEVMGSWPPVQDSHVEMDAIWAAHLVWVKMQAEESEVAIVCGFGKTSEGSPAHVLNLQLEPFYAAAIGLDPTSTAALQASAYMARRRRPRARRDRGAEPPGGSPQSRHAVAQQRDGRGARRDSLGREAAARGLPSADRRDGDLHDPRCRGPRREDL